MDIWGNMPDKFERRVKVEEVKGQTIEAAAAAFNTVPARAFGVIRRRLDLTITRNAAPTHISPDIGICRGYLLQIIFWRCALVVYNPARASALHAAAFISHLSYDLCSFDIRISSTSSIPDKP